MAIQRSSTGKIYLLLTSILGWFALIAQWYIYTTTASFGLTEKLIRYFSYFTILTNLIVAICSTTLLLDVPGKAGRFFKQYKTLTAITVYILIVGIIYNILLRSLWAPQGMQRVVDELLHTVIPLLFLIFWLLFAPKSYVRIKSIFSWLFYPLIYIIFILIRGAYSSYYPYPFVNVNELGYANVTVNSIVITAAFLAVSFVLVAISNFMSRKRE